MSTRHPKRRRPARSASSASVGGHKVYVDTVLKPVPVGALPVEVAESPTAPDLAENGRQHLRRLATSLPFVLVLAVLPFLILIQTRAPIFTPLGHLDPWIYYSFFHHLFSFKHDLFPATYYGSRLPWILIGFVVNQIFTPVTANYVLHLGVFFAVVGAFYYIQKESIGRKTALLGSVLLGLHPYLWRATGRDYIDGIGIAFYLLAAALLVGAAQLKHERALLVLAGISYASMIYSNLAWVPLSPFFLAIYLYFHRNSKEYLRNLGRFALWFTAGVGFITVLLGCINHRLDGTFWFYAPSVMFGSSSFIGGQWQKRGFAWLPKAFYLIYPAAATFFGLISAVPVFRLPPSKWRRAALFFLGNLLFSVAVWVAWEMKGVPALQGVDYAGFLIPPVFLAIGSLGCFAEDLPDRVFWPVATAAVFMFAAPWWDRYDTFRPILSRISFPGLLALIAAILICRSILPQRRWSLVIFLAGASLGTWYVRDHAIAVGPPDGQGNGFNRLVQAMQDVDRVRDGGSMTFWYNADDPNDYEFESMNAFFLWGPTQISRHFPSIETQMPLVAGLLIAVPSTAGGVVEKAAASLRARQLIPEVVEEDPISYSDVRYTLTFLRLKRDPATLQSLSYVEDGKSGRLVLDAGGDGSLAASGWHLGNAKAAIAPVASGLRVTTDADRFGFAAVYKDLTAPADGTYVFDLEYRELKGTIQFGVVGSTGWIAHAGPEQRSRGAILKECVTTLKSGQSFMLSTVNWRPADAARSSFVITGVHAYRLR